MSRRPARPPPREAPREALRAPFFLPPPRKSRGAAPPAARFSARNLAAIQKAARESARAGRLLLQQLSRPEDFLAGGFSGACYSAAVAWAFAGVLLAEFMAFSALWFGGLLLIGQKNTSFNSEVVGVVVFSVAS